MLPRQAGPSEESRGAGERGGDLWEAPWSGPVKGEGSRSGAGQRRQAGPLQLSAASAEPGTQQAGPRNHPLPLPGSPKVKTDLQGADSNAPLPRQNPREDPSSSLKPGPAPGSANLSVGWSQATRPQPGSPSLHQQSQGPRRQRETRTRPHPGGSQPTAVSRNSGILGGFLVDPHLGPGPA